MINFKHNRQLTAYWLPCATGEARKGHPVLGDVYRNDIGDPETGVVVVSRLTVDVFRGQPPAWHAEVRVYERAALYTPGVAAGEPRPHEVRDLDDEDKGKLLTGLLQMLEAVGAAGTDRVEESRYGLHLRRDLSAAELRDLPPTADVQLQMWREGQAAQAARADAQSSPQPPPVL